MPKALKTKSRCSVLILFLAITVLVISIITGVIISITNSRHANSADSQSIEIPDTGEISKITENIDEQNSATTSTESDKTTTPPEGNNNASASQAEEQNSDANTNTDSLGRGNFVEPSVTTSQPISLIQTITREESAVTTNYGTKIITTNLNAYEVYSDGSEKLISSTPKAVQYDFSTFDATAQEMWNEAANQVVAENANIQQVLAMTNYYRAEIGSDPLILDANLSAAASIRAIEMAWSNTFSHTRPNGQNCFSLAQEIGIPFYGENLAYSDDNQMNTGKKAADAWRHSEGHYMNMVATRFKRLGVGVYKFGNRYYFVQLFDE